MKKGDSFWTTVYIALLGLTPSTAPAVPNCGSNPLFLTFDIRTLSRERQTECLNGIGGERVNVGPTLADLSRGRLI